MAGLWAKLLELKQQGKALPPSLPPKASAASDTGVNAAGSSETKEGEGAATARRSPAPSVISEISGAIPADLKSWDQLLPHVSPPEAGSIKPARPPSATWECMEVDSGATGDKVSQGPWVLQQHFEDGKPVHGPGLDASTPVDIPIVHARYLTAGGKTADRRVIHIEVNFEGTGGCCLTNHCSVYRHLPSFFLTPCRSQPYLHNGSQAMPSDCTALTRSRMWLQC